MNFRRTSQKKTSRTRILLGVLFFLIITIVLFKPTVPAFVVSSVHFVATPLMVGTPALHSVSDTVSSIFHSKKALLQRVETLERELLENELRSKTAEVIEQNYETLGALMARSLNEHLIVASVLLRPPQTIYDTLIIDAGSTNGVKKDMLVQSSEGVVLGTVVNVFDTTSVIELFSSHGRETVVHIGKEQIEMIAKGRGGGNFEAEAPRTIPIAEGDIVVLPGFSPKTFAVVEEIIMRPSDAFQRILFKNPSNLFEIRMVGVIDEVTKQPHDDLPGVVIDESVSSTTSEYATSTSNQ